MENVFLEITVIISLAAFLALFFRIIKQPAIVAYILTGIIIGPLGLIPIQSQQLITVLGDLGITLLLFMLGLEIKISDFKSFGKEVILGGLGQIVFSFAFFYTLTTFFGVSSLDSIYIAVALTFSSTVIIVKLLSDTRQLHSLYAKITIGILLLQDFFAILFLIFLSSFNPNTGTLQSLEQIIIVTFKAIVLFGLVIYLSKKVFPQIVGYLSKSPETLFLVSLAWVFGLAAIVSSKAVGFSIEIGGFLAGLSLANSIANFQIIAKAKILRDFFIVLFFVVLGMRMNIANIASVIAPAIILSIFVMIIKPLIVILIMGIMGFRKRTSFLSGFTLAQISEFSLIIVFLGNKIGHISNYLVSLVTMIGIITFMFSPYVIIYGNKLYLTFGRYFTIFERKNLKKEKIVHSEIELDNLRDHIVLVGGDQMGQSILGALEDLEKDVVVVDFDPDIVGKLSEKHIHRLFGDISDYEIQKKASLDRAKLVISTIPNTEDNLLILKELKEENRKAKVVVMALDSHDAKILYKAGADYVILPHLAGGRQIARLLRENNLENIEKLKEKDLGYLV